MNKPTDYPTDAPVTDMPEEPLEDDYTLAMLRDRLAAEQPVTDEMIRAARAKMDSAHSNKERADLAGPNKSRIGRLRKRFR